MDLRQVFAALREFLFRAWTVNVLRLWPRYSLVIGRTTSYRTVVRFGEQVLGVVVHYKTGDGRLNVFGAEWQAYRAAVPRWPPPLSRWSAGLCFGVGALFGVALWLLSLPCSDS